MLTIGAGSEGKAAESCVFDVDQDFTGTCKIKTKNLHSVAASTCTSTMAGLTITGAADETMRVWRTAVFQLDAGGKKSKSLPH